MKFLKNNIEFRQVSSLAMSNFLQSKSFMLGEVIKSDKHKFSSTAKEVLLQMYSCLGSWLQEVVEKEQIASTNAYCDEELISFLIARLSNGIGELEAITLEHSEDFNRKFIHIWWGVYGKIHPSIDKGLRDSLSGKPMGTAFTDLVAFLMKMANHMLFILHEIDSVVSRISKKEKFISIDKFDLSSFTNDNVNLPLARLEVYKNFSCEASTYDLIVKRYLSNEFLDDNPSALSAYEGILSCLESEGYATSVE